jgi:hypothetical protein
MAKKDNIVTINFDIWTTQQQRARVAGIPLNTLSQQVKRALAGEKSKLTKDDIRQIEQLGITLVKRID